MNYYPSRHQMKFKLRCQKEHKGVDWSALTATQIQTLTNNRSVQGWLDDPGFRDWFLETEIVATELQLGAEEAVRALREVVTAEDIGPDGRFSGANYVSAATKLLELAGYTPPSHKIVEYRDKEIEGMDESQLREFVKKNIHLVKA